AFCKELQIKTKTEFNQNIDYYIHRQYPVYNEVNNFQLNELRKNCDQLMQDSDNQGKQIQIQHGLSIFPQKSKKSESTLINRKSPIYLNDYQNAYVFKSGFISQKAKKRKCMTIATLSEQNKIQ
ncbi:hypothetical protein ABPG74_006754, partial [Tetrahymena malaccensis]